MAIDFKEMAALVEIVNTDTPPFTIWMGSRPVAVMENGAPYYACTNHIGCPVMAIYSAGAKVREATYLPFGEVLATIAPPSNNSQFPGPWLQAESGLHQNWTRDYDPTVGCYMLADPLGQGKGH